MKLIYISTCVNCPFFRDSHDTVHAGFCVRDASFMFDLPGPQEWCPLEDAVEMNHEPTDDTDEDIYCHCEDPWIENQYGYSFCVKCDEKMRD